MDDYAEIARLGPANAVRVQVPARTEEDNNTGEVPEVLAVPTAQLAKEWPSCHSNALADSVHSVAKRITRARFLFLNTLSCADSEVQVLVKVVAQISGLSLRESRFRVQMT